MDITHQVNVITVLSCPDRGVLLKRTESGKWGFPGSEDLRPGEHWKDTQLRGLERDIGKIEQMFESVLHLESYPAGVVGPNSKFGVFVLSRTMSAELPEVSEGFCWCKHPEDTDELDLIHPRVKELLQKALNLL